MVTPVLLTSEQYLAHPEDYDSSGNRIKDELIAGEVVLMAPPNRRHDLLKNQICQILVQFLAVHFPGLLSAWIEVAYAIAAGHVYVPDVSVAARSRFLEGDSRIIVGPPDIAIEVVSPSDTAVHLKTKVSNYLAAGARSVWVVYPNDRSIVVHNRQGATEFKIDQRLADEALPGFSEPVAKFFEGL